MKNTLRFFAFLDLISIILLGKQFWGMITHIQETPDQLVSQVKVWLTLFLFVLLFVSAIGLLMVKKIGFIAYYIQFPFRLVVWIFSVGFITYLPELLNLSEAWFNILFRICFIAEFFRLYFTVRIHRRHF
ncbi:hypothetical protein GJU39_15510 [Pedobacter petrophilus]|uniref:Uncharacterized protein n=1 Tax=Pedobacter petrophilus TaxID=1908241 RepID=A0A7K0G290_9SPHI|nr:hypothetical protein [Pedobacter petrophilus]MRX77494.1 hypothetical protein [Pedobacter petrophilus]